MSTAYLWHIKTPSCHVNMFIRLVLEQELHMKVKPEMKVQIFKFKILNVKHKAK